MASPIPKPADRRQRVNKTDMGLVPARPEKVVPAPPPNLADTTVQMWDAYWTSDVSNVVEPASDMPALRRLYQLYDERDRAYEVYRKERFVLGSSGQLVNNPIVRAIRDNDNEIRQLEDRFGLTPLARLRLGVVFGDAKATLDAINSDLGGNDSDEPDPRLQAVIAPDVGASGM